MHGLTERHNDTRLQYAEFLQGFTWDYFLTATFRSPRREPYYALQHVWRELQRHNVARAFLAAEPFQACGDLHIHGIAAGTRNKGSFYGVRARDGTPLNIDTPQGIWHGLFKRFGRAKVGWCNSHEAVSMYCSKYILKQQSRVCDYYELFGNKASWQRG